MPNPTPEQAAFIQALSSTSDSIALNAVAGSGKTTTLVLAANALKPKAGDVLALAFNKKNAEDLAKKLPLSIDCMTLHSLGYRAWQQRVGKRLFIDDKKVGTLCSDVVKDYNLEDNWKDLKALVTHAKNSGLVPQAFAKDCWSLTSDDREAWEDLIFLHNLEDPEGIIPAAREVLTKSIKLGLEGTIDFADMLYLPAIFSAKMPEYGTVFVDEAQDLSEIQHELISRCVRKGGRLIAVGDPKQAIYGFRGAHSSSMEVLKQRFDMTEMPLSFCFRCPEVVVEMAKKLVPQIRCPEGTEVGRFKDFGEAWQLSTLAEDCHTILPNSTILCRNIAPLVRFGLSCFRQGVSCWLAVRDLGAPLVKAAKELKGNNQQELLNSLAEWEQKKTIFANGNLEIIARVADTAEALRFVIEEENAQSPSAIITALQRLFSKESGSLYLTTIHRAKGMEWDRVYLLDPWRIPAFFILKAVERSPEDCAWMLGQEDNLRYIAYTRAKKELYFISYERR